jgi:hypothetical protein
MSDFAGNLFCAGQHPRICGGGDNGGVGSCSVVIDGIPVNQFLKGCRQSFWCHWVVDEIASSYWQVVEGGQVSTVRRELTRGSARTMTRYRDSED